jgi:hypothetical protein
MNKFTFTKQEIGDAYAMLGAAMAKSPIVRSTGEKAEPKDFMLMHQDQTWKHLYFKDAETRNYIIVMWGNKLHIPKTDKPFFRGRF